MSFRYLPFLGLLVLLLLAGREGVSAQASDSSLGVASANAAPGKPVGRMITLSDFGAEDLAYLSVPNTPPVVGIVMVPDVYGLDNFTKAEADRLAAMGYLVLAIDIYNGHVTTDQDDIATISAHMNAESVMKTMDAGIRFFRESPKFKVDHIVALGWGMGATYVFQSARENRMLDGAVTFYGPVETEETRVGKFVVPLCAIYPEVDDIATHDKVMTFQGLMKEQGNDFSAWFIAAGRGWSNPSSKSYNPVEDKEAWKVAIPFIMRIGAEPVKERKGPSIIDKAKDGIKSLFE
jgi:carboxymethylenebutenolidase